MGLIIKDQQQNTNAILTAIDKSHANGEVVVEITISPDLHIALIEEVWKFDMTVVEYVNSFSNIPVHTSRELTGLTFRLISEKGNYRNDA